MAGIETDFVNIVKITQVADVDYIIHFFNTYSNKAWVFKVYKSLFDKGMEIRKLSPLDITVSNSEDEKKPDISENVEKIYT